MLRYDGHPVGEAKETESFTLYSGLSARSRPFSVASTAPGSGRPRQLLHIVMIAVVITEVGGLELPTCLVAEAEGDAGVDHSLALDHVQKYSTGMSMSVKTSRSGFQRKLEPVLLPGVGLLVEPAHILPLLEVEGVLGPSRWMTASKYSAGVLGGAGAQAVEAQGILVVVAEVVVIFAARRTARRTPAPS